MMILHARKVERNRNEVKKLSQKNGNRFCIDCDIRGPLYVVTNFNVFVCSTCAALHRSLQHKVKGISMTEFSDDEIAGLSVCGNERAARVWLQRYRMDKPAHGNDAAIKKFIVSVFQDMVYVDHSEFDKLQEDLLRALGTGSEQAARDSVQAPENVTRRTLTPSQRLGATAATAETVLPSQPQAPNSRLVPSIREVQVDILNQPAMEVTSQPTRVDPFVHVEEKDVFDDFFTAPPPPVVSVSATTTINVSTAPQPSFTDWFTSTLPPNAATVDPQGKLMHGGPSSLFGMQTSSSAPQPFFAEQTQQPSMQALTGKNHDGCGYVSGGGYPSQQQFAYAFSTGVPEDMCVGSDGAPNFHSSKSLAFGAAPSYMNDVKHFQPPPTDLWANPTVTKPKNGEPKRSAEGRDDDAFASLNPFTVSK